MRNASVILYVGAQVPKRSETFVYREIFALREAGQNVLVASVHGAERGLGESILEGLADETIGIYGPGYASLCFDAVGEAFCFVKESVGTVTRMFWDWFRDREMSAKSGIKVLAQTVAGLALARRVRSRAVTHIHAHMAHVPASIALAAARQLGVSFSFTGHAADLFRDRSLLKAKLESAAFVACISNWHREFYSRIVPRTNHEYPVIRCGVDTSQFSPSKKVKDKRLILAVGRLVPKKGFDVLVRACAALRTRERGFHVIIGGDGPEYERLRKLRDELAPDCAIQLPGVLTNSQVRELLGETALFVLPSRVDDTGDRDGIPVVLMEAMAAGVACVGGDLPTIRELIVDAQMGRLVRSDNVEALRGALEELLEDEPLRLQMGMNGRNWVEEEFSTTANTPRLIAAFERSWR